MASYHGYSKQTGITLSRYCKKSKGGGEGHGGDKIRYHGKPVAKDKEMVEREKNFPTRKIKGKAFKEEKFQRLGKKFGVANGRNHVKKVWVGRGSVQIPLES